MTVSVFDPSAIVSLTDSAQKYFSEKVAKKPDHFIRLSTKVSGCTGFAYVLDITDSPLENDTIVNFDNINFAVASESMAMLSGIEIDLVKEGVNQVVKYNNPNVAAECGCGESFNVS
ncbi:iron-sulfur cluster assembly accessory protein [Vibrio sp. 1-Bac 57]|uniref:HesB/IscA family protein n=1 Tax=Psychromonas sp. SA13A TaxID=2686346 RepID=UPI00140D4B56|nr:iron-sulfur cluster assembly accessory protein [Psychromonas sp. SA13A]